MRDTRGITLISLVVTIIILLILAGISIATLTGQNGVLTKVSTAKEESKKAEYKEILELIGNGIKPEKTLEQLDTKTFMDRYEEKIREKTRKGETLEGATIERISDTIIRVTTKEGYVYKVTENEVEYLGKYGENTPPSIQESEIDFNLNPSEYTTENVEVEIVVKIDIEGYTLQYSTDGNNWTNYVEKAIFNENGNIYARLINEIGETGGVATKGIHTIDREDPNRATITFSSRTTDTDNSITATITQTDNGTSGVDFTNSRWKYSTESGEIGANPSSYTGGNFSKSPEEIPLRTTTIGNYYLHVLTIDKAGNARETIEGPITVTKAMAKVGVIVTGENKEYTKNGTAIIPVGFAIKPGCDDVSNGLVISDVANDIDDTGNQFVWVPVTNGDVYKRDNSYPCQYTVFQYAYDDSDFLPARVSNEQETVLNAGGFYIGRYETGIGLVSKKGATPWTNLHHNSAKSESKNFISNKFVTSALISGTQWDVTLKFVNGRQDGIGQIFDVRNYSAARTRSGVGATGIVLADKVCNIFDLEGNCKEFTAERGEFGSSGWGFQGSPLQRGGNRQNVNICAGYRTANQGASAENGFRMVLYIL